MELDEHEEGEVTLPPPVPVSVSYDRPRTKSMTPSSRDHFSARKLQVKYRECLRNHAVGIGGHATDGCGEFMPAGEEGTIDALKCAACNCHRNFHRREGDHGSEPFTPSPHSFYRSLPVAGGGYVSSRTVPHPLPLHPQPLHANNVHHLHHREEQEEEVVDHHGGNGGTGSSDGGGGSGVMTGKKRFRTKFTQDQKERMLEFAEKLGWRIQKHDEEAVQRFCMETGVRRHVLKVWMHNNKHTLGKKSLMHEGGGGGGDLPCSDKVYNSSEEDGPKI